MTEDLESFREEVRDFVTAELPAGVARKVTAGQELERADYEAWQRVLRKRGWFAGAWPKAWGGAGWSAPRQLAFLQECALAGAPMISPYGVNMVGPVIQSFGNDAQKERHIPGILDSTVWWCQGYSEPGAGSDLAGLRTAALRDGDHYVVNGSKMWTTEAHWADWMHCLVRTDASGKPQQGISFLLIDMTTPGITIQPIVTIDGQHHTNQVFFDDVRVPVENLVGTEGDGWKIAKFLLGHERLSIADTGPKMRLMRTLDGMVQAVLNDPLHSEALKARISARHTELTVKLETLIALESFFVKAWEQGRPTGSDGSILKIRGTEVLQNMSEFALDLEGAYASVHDPALLHGESVRDLQTGAFAQASALAHQYLYSRCWSIFGGTNEIQRNIIARSVLG